MSRRPRKYEFSDYIKKEALRLAHHKCEICGEKASLEIHHRIYCWFAAANNIPHAVISSLANAECLCSRCHDIWHKYVDVPTQYIIDDVMSKAKSTAKMF